MITIVNKYEYVKPWVSWLGDFNCTNNRKKLFYGSSQYAESMVTFPQRLSLRPAIPPTQNTKSRRGETEVAERTTLRKFAKECVSVSTHLIDRRPTARNPTPSLNLGLFSNFAVLYFFEQLDSWWNKKTDQGLSHIYHATCRPIMIHVVKELFPRFWYIAV